MSKAGAIRYYKPTDPSAVYRIFDVDNDVIYIGMSYNPEHRVKIQRTTTPWRAEFSHWTAEWFPDRETCKAAEVKAIREEQPRHNVAETPEHWVRSLKGYSPALLEAVQQRSATYTEVKRNADRRSQGKRKDAEGGPTGVPSES